MGKRLAIVLTALALCLLCGCERTVEAVDEAQILSDLRANAHILNTADLEIVSSEVVRYPGEEGDFEAVQVTYTAENPSAVYHGGMMLYYGLYDEEWSLNTYDLLESSYEPKESCPLSIPLDHVSGLIADVSGSVEIVPMGGRSVDALTEDFYFTVQWQKSDIAVQHEDWEVNCAFDLVDGWYVQDWNNEISGITWDICGTYTVDNDAITAQIEITDFQIDAETRDAVMTVSFSLTSHLSNDDIWGGPAMTGGTTYYTTAPGTVTLTGGYDREYYVFRIEDYADVYICGEEISWDPIGPGTGVWLQILGNYANTYGEYWLTKQ